MGQHAAVSDAGARAMHTHRPLRLAVSLPDLSGGGAERLHLGLAPLWDERGIELRLLLDRRAGALLDLVPEYVRVDSLGAERQLTAIARLVRYCLLYTSPSPRD